MCVIPLAATPRPARSLYPTPPSLSSSAGASWAFATAAAVDAAWAITFNTSAPVVSRQQLMDCTYAGLSTLDGGCLGGHPGDALEYTAGLSALGIGLRSAAAYPFQGMGSSTCSSNPQVRRDSGSRSTLLGWCSFLPSSQQWWSMLRLLWGALFSL